MWHAVRICLGIRTDPDQRCPVQNQDSGHTDSAGGSQTRENMKGGKEEDKMFTDQ